MTFGTYLWRGLLVVGAFGLAWVSLVNGISGYYADRVAAGDDGLIDHALGWNPDHPSMLFEKALKILPEDPQAAMQLLERSYLGNPADPFPLIVMAVELLEDGEVERSDAMIELATKLAPVDSRVQEAIATYWAKRERFDRMLAHWSTVLEADRSRQELLFPRMLAIVEDPRSRVLLEPFALDPPSWWTQYFWYVSLTAVDAEPVRFLYALRRQSAREQVMPDERAAYVWRLQKEGAIVEAYMIWMSGLDDNARQHVGLLFDGGFELPINGTGFGWSAAAHDHFSAKPSPTHGASGRAALGLRFRRFEGYFYRVSQPLVLDPGTYRLSGRVRIDSLASQGGVRWVVRCVLPEAQILGEGPRFLGSAPWGDFDILFEVPENCVSQQLILMSGGARDFELKLDGQIWFDDLKIVRSAALDAAARADALLRGQSSREGSSTNTEATVGEGN